jgi:hypothetical protein
MMLWAGAGVLAVGIAVPAIAYAQDPTPSPSASTQQKGADNAEFAAALAKELGLDEQKVSDALTKVRAQLHPEGKGDKGTPADAADRTAKLKERLAQAVTDGKISQAEADAILKASEAGVLGGGPGGHKR